IERGTRTEEPARAEGADPHGGDGALHQRGDTSFGRAGNREPWPARALSAGDPASKSSLSETFMKKLLKPHVLVPAILSVALIVALLAFADLKQVVALMAGFRRNNVGRA